MKDYITNSVIKYYRESWGYESTPAQLEKLAIRIANDHAGLLCAEDVLEVLKEEQAKVREMAQIFGDDYLPSPMITHEKTAEELELEWMYDTFGYGDEMEYVR